MSGDREAKSYKQTLNLPKTDFSMRAGLAKREPETIARWNEMDLYGAIQAHRKDAPKYILHDGPPYANGSIHHGHILNKVLKDFVVKYQTMSGHRVPYVPGWDCHGLPIEQKVDEELGKKKREMTQVEIRKACRAYAKRFVDIQRDEFARVGVFAQWDDPYVTMSTTYESQTVRILGEFFRAGNVYKGLKPVHWSWAAQTALADAEVEYDEYTAPSIYVKFGFDAAPDFIKEAAGDRPVSVVIWTTTPWTLPANLAIALHPDFKYVVVGIGGEGKHAGSALVMAEGLMKDSLSACKIDDYEILGTFEGHQLVGRTPEDAPRLAARHPFLDRDSVLLPADYVTLEQGTGCVHTAPGHGQEDFHLGQTYGLDVLNPVDNRGLYTNKFAEMEGELVFKANPKIVAKLDDLGVLLSHPKLSVKIDRYPHCWRTKKPVIFRATEQWFIGLDLPIKDAEGAETGDTLRDRALREIDNVQWVPSWGRDRILGMMENRPDWCISRQRLWGVPITVFYCDACDTDIVDHRVAFHVADCAEEHGSDIWFDWTNTQLVPEGFTCPGCGADPETFRKESDILDVWFDSGVSWSAVVDRKMGEGEVADLYLEGSDQHRGWFNSSLLASAGTRNRSPYKTCLTHGFVMDQEGRKYSKSSKNYVSPSKMINIDGAEILRIWVAAVDYRVDMTLSPETLKTAKDGYRKIRNTCRFLLGTLGDFEPDKHTLSMDALTDLDRWALARTKGLIEDVRGWYESFDFHRINNELVRFCTVELSNTYLNALKDKLYASDPEAPSRRASQTVLFEILSALVRLMAPVLVFTSEEIWGHMPHRSSDTPSVHMADMPEAPEDWGNPAILDRFERLWKVRGELQRQIEKVRYNKKQGERQPGQIGNSEEAVVTFEADGDWADLIEGFGQDLHETFIVSKTHLERGPVADSEEREVPVIVSIVPSSEGRCPRCWRFGNGVGSVEAHPDLCQRCATVIASL